VSRPVSIVVLTHNNLRYTEECVEAIERHTEDYQLVVVDNASSDDTPEYLRRLEDTHPNVSAILNRENLGFAGGCNQGVSAARHGTVCLLNNDAVPRAGWLDRMKDVLEKGVGAVGAKLLLPDGTIQHAGIEFMRRQEPAPHFWPYHRFLNEPADTALANFLEEVPAVTAACLLTTKTVWDRVGGMDEGYIIANFEDVDFNLAVRDAHMKVLYQPEAELLHYWGTTVGSKGDAPDSPARYFDHNFERLMTKWFDKLSRGLARVG
jgi:GT2 family glycosyltransferase